MSEKKWIHKENCEIVRPGSNYSIQVPGQAVLMDASEGDRVFVVPESWTDDQIWECLRVANTAFGCGHTSGEHSKAREIVKALFLEC